jgi:hypothetical protein
MKLNWQYARNLNTGEGDEGGASDFSAWADGDMTDVVDEPQDADTQDNQDTDDNADNADTDDSNDSQESGDKDESSDELGGEADKPTDEADTDESDADEPKTPEDIIAEIKEDEANKDLSEEELQTKIEEALNEASSEDTELGGTEEVGDVTDETLDWSTVAGSLDIVDGEDIKIESKEDLNNYIKERIDSEVNAVKKQSDEYFGLTQEAKSMAKFMAENGIDAVQRYLDPLSGVDKYLAMSKEALVEENLKAVTDEKGNQYYTDDEIAEKMVDLQEDPKALKAEYDKVYLALVEQKKSITNDIAGRMEADMAERASLEKQADLIESKAVEAVLSRTEKFMDSTINKNGKSSIMEMVKSGEAEKLMRENPEFLVNSLLYYKFGETAQKNLVKREFEKGRNKSLATLHNIPSINGGNDGSGKSRVANKSASSDSDFSAWAD